MDALDRWRACALRGMHLEPRRRDVGATREHPETRKRREALWSAAAAATAFWVGPTLRRRKATNKDGAGGGWQTTGRVQRLVGCRSYLTAGYEEQKAVAAATALQSASRLLVVWGMVCSPRQPFRTTPPCGAQPSRTAPHLGTPKRSPGARACSCSACLGSRPAGLRGTTRRLAIASACVWPSGNRIGIPI